MPIYGSIRWKTTAKMLYYMWNIFVPTFAWCLKSNVSLVPFLCWRTTDCLHQDGGSLGPVQELRLSWSRCWQLADCCRGDWGSPGPEQGWAAWGVCKCWAKGVNLLLSLSKFKATRLAAPCRRLKLYSTFLYPFPFCKANEWIIYFCVSPLYKHIKNFWVFRYSGKRNQIDRILVPFPLAQKQ